MKGLSLKTGRDFVLPGYEPRYPREYWFLIYHADIYIRTDVYSRSFSGRTIHRIELLDYRDYLELDAVDLSIKGVYVDGSTAKYMYDGSKLYVRLQTTNPNKLHNVEIVYEARPVKGLHFIFPRSSSDYPQVWSQGEAEDTRYWIPIYDYPNMRLTWTLTAEVPGIFTVVSNGDLEDVSDIGNGYRRWKYRMNHPMPPYLIALAIGVFDEIEDGVNGVRLRYLVPRGSKAIAMNSFSKTPDMIRFFSEYLGFRYPYNSYTQVCLKEFIVGGMENVTATFLTEWTLHDEIAHKEFSSDPLVAHELAHQWFGDLVTCKDWSNIWLNESFATYLEALYTRKDKGEDEFIYELYGNLKSYLEEYKRYSRPIVMRIYKDPDELFDSHSYPKGALVLHTLKNLIGEERFRLALKTYLERYKFRSVDTEDLRKVFEEVSGRDLEWFFDQYVYSSGHPVIKVRSVYDYREKVLKIFLKQDQGQDSLEVYRIPVRLLIRHSKGSIEKSVFMESREKTVYMDLEEPPLYVCPNPDFDVFAVFEVEDDIEILGNMIKDDHVYCRLLAIEALSKKTSSRAVEILSRALEAEEFWGVQAEIARALGKIGGEEAKKTLISSLKKLSNPRARRAVAEALSNFRADEEVAKALLEVLSNPSETYYVRASAASSLGKTRIGWAYTELIKYLNTPSHVEIITRGVIQGLANLGGEDSLRTILKYIEQDKHTMVRVAAASSLGKFPGRRDVIEKLIEIVRRDPSHRVRIAAISAMEELKYPEFIEVLDEVSEKDPIGFVRRRAREASKRIKDHMERSVEYKHLREELEKLREESRRIVEKIERFEAKGIGV
ncbi:MAG: M1 family aminopeptidase [Desulfurococcales archaeon]|nr:M1 family aminopeptidase [Desulfurococcales archaeon]